MKVNNSYLQGKKINEVERSKKFKNYKYFENQILDCISEDRIDIDYIPEGIKFDGSKFEEPHQLMLFGLIKYKDDTLTLVTLSVDDMDKFNIVKEGNIPVIKLK